jgi:hypothetical protein
MKNQNKCYICKDTGVMKRKYSDGGGKIAPCILCRKDEIVAQAQKKLEEKRRKLGITA